MACVISLHKLAKFYCLLNLDLYFFCSKDSLRKSMIITQQQLLPAVDTKGVDTLVS